MTSLDPYLLIRASAVYVAVVLTFAACAWHRPGSRAIAGAVLASIWNLPVILALDLAAARLGWWHFDAHGGLLLGMPVDMYLSWAWLWGAVPALAFPALPLAVVVIAALTFDLLLMPAAFPVLQLGPAWLNGEAIGLLVGFVPGQLLARWTARDGQLEARAVLQFLAFSGLLLFVLPAIAVQGSGGTWSNPAERPAWELSLIVQLLAVPAVIGLTAVQEFVTRGFGTPVPFDAPRRLVTTGVYAYVRNPMQLSAVVLLSLLGVILGNLWVSATGVMAHIYSVGLAGWDEEEDLRRRFGDSWVRYRSGVRSWIPRWRPWFPDGPDARLFVAGGCNSCQQVGRWVTQRGAIGLVVVPAQTHPTERLTRITYEPGDGTAAARGVEALARAMEHIHLGWALVAFLVRLPIVCQLIQLLVDASGGEPRSLAGGACQRS